MPVSHIRKQIAQHMKASLEISARAWNAVEVNMENVARLRERTKDAFKAREGFGLTYMPFVTRAVSEALLAHPMVNSELRGEEIAVKHFVNMGIAVSYDEGLIVPVLKGDGHDEPARDRTRDQRPRHAGARQEAPARRGPRRRRSRSRTLDRSAR